MSIPLNSVFSWGNLEKALCTQMYHSATYNSFQNVYHGVLQGWWWDRITRSAFEGSESMSISLGLLRNWVPCIKCTWCVLFFFPSNMTFQKVIFILVFKRKNINKFHDSPQPSKNVSFVRAFSWQKGPMSKNVCK